MKIINKKLIISIALIIMILILLTNSVFAALNPDDPNWDPRGKGESSEKFLTRAGTVLGVIKVIGIVVSIATLMIIAVKYLFSSVEGKAEYKKTMVPYIIGCIMVIAIITIVEIIESIAKFE